MEWRRLSTASRAVAVRRFWVFVAGAAVAFAGCSVGTARPSGTATSGLGGSTVLTAPPTSADLTSLAADAYVWGSPLVISMRTVQTFARLLGVNHLTAQQALSD